MPKMKLHRMQTQKTEQILPHCHKVAIGNTILYEGADGNEATQIFLAAMALFADRIEHTLDGRAVKEAPALGEAFHSWEYCI